MRNKIVSHERTRHATGQVDRIRTVLESLPLELTISRNGGLVIPDLYVSGGRGIRFPELSFVPEFQFIDNDLVAVSGLGEPNNHVDYSAFTGEFEEVGRWSLTIGESKPFDGVEATVRFPKSKPGRSGSNTLSYHFRFDIPINRMKKPYQ